MKLHDWGLQNAMIQARIYNATIVYLASQVQEKLPYRIQYVNSNDEIFIGNDDFKKEAESLMDYCFDQILELVT